MLDIATTQGSLTATDAERFCLEIEKTGTTAIMIVPPHGRPWITFQSAVLPWPPRAVDIAQVIRSRFYKEPQFQRDLFGWLYAEGRVYQQYAERQPKIALDGLSERSGLSSKGAR